MTKEEIRKAGVRLYGKHWQARMASRLRVNPSTVRRWASGASPIPGTVQAWIECEMVKQMNE